jgi:hypothetical protein
MAKIEHQHHQEYGDHHLPKRVLRLGAQGRGCLRQIRHEPLQVDVSRNTGKQIVTMVAFHVDEVQNFYVHALLFEQRLRKGQSKRYRHLLWLRRWQCLRSISRMKWASISKVVLPIVG